MNTMRRFGTVAREQKGTVDTGLGNDPNQPGNKLRHRFQLIEILEKIPLFRGLSLLQFKEILNICGQRGVPQDEYIVRAGDEPQELFILLQGTLKVTLNDGKEVSRIEPIGIVGEMGVFTGERRSANIVTATPVLLLSLHRLEIVKLIRQDVDLGIRILLNVIQELSNKVRRDNEVIQYLKQFCPAGISEDMAPSREPDDAE